MADFLARLSARALGVGPVARPRVRALFESSPDALAPPQTTSMEADAAETPVTVGAAAAVAVDARGSRGATPLRPDASPPPNDRESQFQRPRQLAPTPIVAAEKTREPVSPPNGTGVPSREPSLPPIVAAVAPHGGDADGELDRSSQETRLAVAAVAARADEAIVSQHSADASLEQPVAPAQRRPTRMEARGPSSHRVRSGNRQPADQAPVIRVTIGRVEVRAVMPAQPPPPRATPRSTLRSLDDYLKPPTRN